MSSPPSEPGQHAAPTTPVSTEPEKAYKKSRASSPSKIPRWAPSQTPQKKPSSLLTEALKTNRETEQSALGAGTSSRSSLSPQSRQRATGLNTEFKQTKPAKMAIVASASAGNLRTGMNAGPSPTFPNFSLRDFNGPNSSPMNHRQHFNSKARGRGTSLERTPKERRVQEVPKGTYSTNPGDTGIPGPPAPTPLATSESISNNPPTEGVRAEYRSWRNTTPVRAAEKAWSIGDQRSKNEEDGQVERSVKDVLAGVEHDGRSRKASHSLGFFREGRPEDKTKKRDNKNRGTSKDPTVRGKDVIDNGSEKQKGKASYTTGDGPGSNYSTVTPSPVEAPEHASKWKMEGRKGGPSHSSDTSVEDNVRSLPPKLLDEIRKHHNLTAGGGKGSSFSPSIPRIESEKAYPGGDVESAKAISTIREEEAIGDDAKAPVRRTDDDEDSGEEQVSSALFIPHQASHEPRDRIAELSDSDDGSLQGENRLETKNSRQWLEEHEVPSDEVDVYVSPESTRALPSPTLITQNDLSELKSPGLNDIPDVDHGYQDDGGYSTLGEESGVEDDDTTPTGSLKKDHTAPSAYGQLVHEHQQKTQQPLEAIELIPYRHQVGGHTTMWRFSKAAVCKQLNNRENEFYERIERFHPLLLKFLPRYVLFLSIQLS